MLKDIIDNLPVALDIIDVSDNDELRDIFKDIRETLDDNKEQEFILKEEEDPFTFREEICQITPFKSNKRTLELNLSAMIPPEKKRIVEGQKQHSVKKTKTNKAIILACSVQCLEKICFKTSPIIIEKTKEQ